MNKINPIIDVTANIIPDVLADDLNTAPSEIIYGTDNGVNNTETLNGTANADRIFTGGGDDVVNAGDGDDFIYARADYDNGQKNIDGGLGNDKVFIDTLSTAEVSGGAGDDIIVNEGSGITTLTGGDGIDRIKGGTNSDTIRGDSGADLLWGRAGSDFITGGSGNDIIDGGAGGDTMWGGEGDDLILDRGDTSTVNYVYGGDGNDTVNLRLSEANNEVYGDHANDGLTLTDGSADGNDNIQTGSGADKIYGGGGDDHVRAGAGDDDIFGGAGNDKLWGGDGYNEIYGGDGYDIIHVDGIDGGVYDAGMKSDFTDGGLIYGSDGNETIVNANKAYGNAGHDNFTDVREVHAGDGNDTIRFANIDGSQSVVAHLGAGNDDFDGATLTQNAYVKADSGENFIETGSGNDKIWGGTDAADDTILGGAGDDILFSGTGGSASASSADILFGGEGSDTFVMQSFNQFSNTFIDYKQGEDAGIDIGDYLDSVGYSGNSPIADGYITYGYIDDGFTHPETNQAMDMVWMSFDATGSGNPDLNFGTIIGDDLSALNLTEADFIIA